VERSFIKQIEKGLAKCSRGDVVLFAWRCAVYALPFLLAKESLSIGTSRQKHLLSVFRALDLSMITESLIRDDSVGSVPFFYFANRTFREATSAGDSFAYDSTAGAFAAYASAYASMAAITLVTDKPPNEVINSAINAVDAAVNAADANFFDLKPILLKELDTIESLYHESQFNTSFYNKFFKKLQQLLNDIHCNYWADWYANLFIKGTFDIEEVKMRFNAPKEIRDLGVAEVGRYMQQIKEKGGTRLNETRVLILGEKGAGKTSLAQRLKNPSYQMHNNEESTEGVDVNIWRIPSDSLTAANGVNVHIWDFAGHVITHAVHRCFMSERCLYILLVNGRTEGDNKTEYWLEQIRNYGGESPILILVNKRDKHPIELMENQLKKEFPSILGFHYFDLKKDKDALENFRQEVTNQLKTNPSWRHQQIQIPAYEVKEAMHKLFAQGSESIKRHDFNNIAEKVGVSHEEQNQLLKDLHTLGICLNYKFDDTMILNPGWISHGIYRLINWGKDRKIDTITDTDFKEAFAGKESERYPVGKAKFMFWLMREYELAVSFDESERQIFVPLLLRADRTDEALLPKFEIGQRLLMEYKANQALPPYTVSRLAVRHAAEHIKEKSWRFGAVLHWHGVEAMVEEDARKGTVTVYVKDFGEKQTAYIVKLRTTLDSIFDDYKSNRPELSYEVLLPPEEYYTKPTLPSFIASELLQTDTNIKGSAKLNQPIVINHITYAFPHSTVNQYKIGGNYIENDHSQTITFNQCAVDLQAVLNQITGSLKKSNPEAQGLINELELAVDDLAKIKESVQNSPEGTSLKEEGRFERLNDIYSDTKDETSELYKKIAILYKGTGLISKLQKNFECLAQYMPDFTSCSIF